MTPHLQGWSANNLYRARHGVSSMPTVRCPRCGHVFLTFAREPTCKFCRRRVGKYRYRID